MESVRVSHRRGILLMQKSRKQDDFILLHICLSLKHTKCIQGRRRGGGVKTIAAEAQASVPCVKYARFTCRR